MDENDHVKAEAAVLPSELTQTTCTVISLLFIADFVFEIERDRRPPPLPLKLGTEV